MKSQAKGRSVNVRKYVRNHMWLYLLLLPGALYFLIFNYVPMFGVIIAFQNYNPYLGFLKSPFVGLANFKNFFAGFDFGMLLKNTLTLSVLSLIFGFPMPILVALFLNELRNQTYKRAVQTLIYVPHFVSYVIVASLTYTLFNINDGIIHELIQIITGKSIDLLSSPQYFPVLIIGQSLWKETGYGTIVFLAALSGTDQELYDAAKVDGAGRWRLMWHITLPAIRSTIVIMLILRVGAILNTGYEQIFLMRNDLNRSASEVFDTYVYTKGITQGQYSLSTAAGIFKSIVSAVMIIAANKVAQKCGESGIY